MDFMELAKGRYSVRKYLPQPVEQEKLDKILAAGQIAPTAVNFQPQRILVLNTPEDMEKLKACTPSHYNAPAALLVCYDKDSCWVRKFDGKNSGDIDASIVTTHMMLEAQELGLGSVWVMHFDPAMIQSTYQIPQQYVPSALLVLGYPAEDAAPAPLHDQKQPLEHTVFYHQF